MLGEFTINGKDAYTNWGLTFDETSVSALMTPAGLKDFTMNTSRTISGDAYLVSNPMPKSREISLSMNITAPSREAFLSRYNSFCQELEKGELTITTRYTGQATYHFIYQSCRQFEQFNGAIGKFVLSLIEPDIKNR